MFLPLPLTSKHRYDARFCVLAASKSNYRQDAAKRQTAGIKFTHRPKIGFFAPQGRLVAPIHVKLGRADGHVGLLGCAKFHLNRQRGWGGNVAPKLSKISTFWQRVAPQGRLP